MAQSDEKIQKLFAELPETYRLAVQKVDIEEEVNKIAGNHGLDEGQTVYLDREVTYLLLRLQSAADFITRIEKKLNVNGRKAAAITNDVTDQILRPVEEKLRSGDSDQKVPIPPPPPSSENAPDASSYGGGTDPYKEPTN